MLNYISEKAMGQSSAAVRPAGGGSPGSTVGDGSDEEDEEDEEEMPEELKHLSPAEQQRLSMPPPTRLPLPPPLETARGPPRAPSPLTSAALRLEAHALRPAGSRSGEGRPQARRVHLRSTSRARARLSGLLPSSRLRVLSASRALDRACSRPRASTARLDRPPRPPRARARAVKRKAFGMMLVGLTLILVFSDPMVDVMSNVGARIGVPPFYVSFVLAPLASNASELIASLTYAPLHAGGHLALRARTADAFGAPRWAHTHPQMGSHPRWAHTPDA